LGVIGFKSSTSEGILTLFPVIERFEEAEGHHPGDVSIADLPGVLKLKKELCEANVWYIGICCLFMIALFIFLLQLA
jgi:hypothetical protein